MLRKQLILAQVQLMELEDLRDELRTGLVAAHALLHQNRQLTDSTLQTQDRIEAAHRELQEECTRLRTSLRQIREQEVGLVARLTQSQADIAARDRTLQDVHAVLATLRQRIAQLETKQHALEASRSWRWTTPLRALERFFRQQGGRAK